MLESDTLYALLSGPFFLLSITIFAGASLYRIVRLLYIATAKEKGLSAYISLKYSMRSIAHWMTPFAAHNMRRHPVMTVVTFLFHFCLLVTPLFLTAHVLMLNTAWGIKWVTLPGRLADVMTLIVIASCAFFLIRRVALREVAYLTTVSDYVLLAAVAAPFVSGFLAYHGVGHYRTIINIHMLSGELLLAAIPFTRLSHMLFAPLTRAYIGSEFGGVRHARDW